ncbi:MAG: hypothetical protein PHE67_06695 [Campylobacterales bacterium]|nr:hypothetical protein [Campylobacterales bacterium]
MDKSEFKKKLASCGLKKADFASMLGLSYSAVNNWGTSSEFPRWVESWLDNFALAKQAQNTNNLSQITVSPIVKDAFIAKRDEIIEILCLEISKNLDFNHDEYYENNLFVDLQHEAALAIEDSYEEEHIEKLRDKLHTTTKEQINFISKSFEVESLLRKLISMLKI